MIPTYEVRGSIKGLRAEPVGSPLNAKRLHLFIPHLTREKLTGLPHLMDGDLQAHSPVRLSWPVDEVAPREALGRLRVEWTRPAGRTGAIDLVPFDGDFVEVMFDTGSTPGERVVVTPLDGRELVSGSMRSAGKRGETASAGSVLCQRGLGVPHRLPIGVWLPETSGSIFVTDASLALEGLLNLLTFPS